MRHATVLGALLLLAAGTAHAADPVAGERAFAVCRSCHAIGPGAQNGIGPAQNGLVGRKAGTYPGYAYSAANRASGLTWDEATLRDYIRDPKGVVPGTKMMFAGLKDDRRIADLIAFLALFDAQGNRAAP
jgi:cytochrome c